MRAAKTLLSEPYGLSFGTMMGGLKVCIHSATVTQVSPGLTSVRQPTGELARRAAALLIAAANAGGPPVSEILRLKCTLIERGSTRSPSNEFQGDRLP